MFNYDKYILEKNSTDELFDVECYINEDYILEVSGQKNIKDAIENELNWSTIGLIKYEKISENTYRLIIKLLVNKKDKIKYIQEEFEWFNQSGIRIIKINKINDKR